MKIATYNVRNLYDAGTYIDDKPESLVPESFFNTRISFFTEQFRNLDVDILCLQEVGGEKGVSRIAEALGYNYFCAKPNKRGIRMAVLYKKALASRISCESVSLGELFIPPIEKEGDTAMLKPIRQRRHILEITLQYAGKFVSINTFHLKSNLPEYLEDEVGTYTAQNHVDAKFRCVLYKTLELCAIKKHSNTRLEEGKEVILLGDYNENNTASMMDILKSSHDESMRLNDILEKYEGDITTHYHRGGHLTFDTILVSQGLLEKVKGVHIENKDLKDCSLLPLNSEVIGSDHALVWGEFAF